MWFLISEFQNNLVNQYLNLQDTVKQLFTGVSFTGGKATIALSSGGTFKPGGASDITLGTSDLLNNYIVTVTATISNCTRNVGDIIQPALVADTKITSSGTILGLDTNVSAENFTASVLATVVYDNLATGFRTKTIVNAFSNLCLNNPPLYT